MLLTRNIQLYLRFLAHTGPHPSLEPYPATRSRHTELRSSSRIPPARRGPEAPGLNIGWRTLPAPAAICDHRPPVYRFGTREHRVGRRRAPELHLLNKCIGYDGISHQFLEWARGIRSGTAQN